jgi:hypothetical protein
VPVSRVYHLKLLNVTLEEYLFFKTSVFDMGYSTFDNSDPLFLIPTSSRFFYFPGTSYSP